MNAVRTLLSCSVAALAFGCSVERSMPLELSALGTTVATARVGPPGTCCFLEGQVVRTVAPPASFPNEGRDPLYAFTSGGAAGQLAVIGVGPGQPEYHGGAWAFYSVTWNVAPYLITSDEQLLAAADAGDLSITRVPANDFRCPIQP